MAAKLDDPSVVTEICERLASGEAMHVICQDAHMPSTSMVYARMGSDEAFRTSIARAREAQQDFEADNIVRMADDATEEDWQVVKMRIWARQWRAAKLAPKRYGEATLMKHAGADGEGPVQTALAVTFVNTPKALTDER